MFGRHLEEEYANNLSAAGSPRRGAGHWLTLILINGGILALIIWAYFAKIEEVTTGQGRVIPSSQLQVVQTLEGGIINAIHVREGDIVDQNQVLIRIDDTGFSSQLGELQQKEMALRAERVRLLVESGVADKLEFSDQLRKDSPQAVSAQEKVHLSRLVQISKELDILRGRLLQRQSELQELNARIAKIENTLVPLRQEVNLTRSMVSRGVVPKIDLLRLEGRMAEFDGDLAIVKAAIPKVEASIAEANDLISSTKNNFELSAREKLAPLEAELAVVRQTMLAAKDRVSRTDLRAPVRGIINKINITTVGAVVRPGLDVVEIVPIDDGLLIEAKIRPQDVAFIKPNESASIKLTAYDYLIYGALEGTVVRIGADTNTDANGESFYKVIIKTTQNFLGDEETKFPIIPGMIATVDIQTGTNSMLSYLLKPVLRARAEAFRER